MHPLPTTPFHPHAAPLITPHSAPPSICCRGYLGVLLLLFALLVSERTVCDGFLGL